MASSKFLTRATYPIQQSRWALICVLCRERVGACIQCSVKTCKTAYHVTCAFKHGLEMRAIIDEDNSSDDDNTVKLRVISSLSINADYRCCNSDRTSLIHCLEHFSLIARSIAPPVRKKPSLRAQTKK